MADDNENEKSTPAEPEPGTAEALAAGHAKGQSILHGASPASLGAPASDVPAEAGEYTLIASRWNELTSAAGQALRTFKTWRRGAIVTLDEATAERLLRAGAVVPTKSSQAKATAAQEPTTLDKATAIADAVGQQPIKDLPGQGQPVNTAT